MKCNMTTWHVIAIYTDGEATTFADWQQAAYILVNDDGTVSGELLMMFEININGEISVKMDADECQEWARDEADDRINELRYPGPNAPGLTIQ